MTVTAIETTIRPLDGFPALILDARPDTGGGSVYLADHPTMAGVLIHARPVGDEGRGPALAPGNALLIVEDDAGVPRLVYIVWPEDHEEPMTLPAGTLVVERVEMAGPTAAAMLIASHRPNWWRAPSKQVGHIAGTTSTGETTIRIRTRPGEIVDHPERSCCTLVLENRPPRRGDVVWRGPDAEPRVTRLEDGDELRGVPVGELRVMIPVHEEEYTHAFPAR